MTIIYFILAVLALGILVFFHELGHYFVARKVGMTVETFSIGFGRPILKWRLHGVDWQVGWLPFGGYVKIAGMEIAKKDKKTYVDPYSIPNGFFTKSPARRIAVAIAGPITNFTLAFLIFAIIWASGGREKPFNEFTQIIGWVDPGSEVYAMGIRPGDILTKYDGHPFNSSKDLLYAAMLGGKQVKLSGYHFDYANDEKIPFTYEVDTYPAPFALEGILTTGITSTASYLIYTNKLTEGSPMQGSGIELKDQLVWANGELLFSQPQLSYLVNNDEAYLTIKRGKEYFTTHQPRVLARDLTLPSYVRDELTDWQYEQKIEGALQSLALLPFVINSEGYVEAPLKFIDAESKQEAYPLHPYSTTPQSKLLPGDQIVAVDGIKVTKGYEIVKLLQQAHVQLIVKRDEPIETNILWRQEDQVFQEQVDWQNMQTIANSIGTPNPITNAGQYVLLNPVEPKSLSQFQLSQESIDKLTANYEEQKKEIDAIKDPDRRRQTQLFLDQSYQKLMLGVPLQDRLVDYNPNPFYLFGTVFAETWQTLKALITGHLHVKWISGPVGIVQVIHHGWQLGIQEALFWIAAISLNLGFLNLMPIPVLDGGYICLSLWEWITKRRLQPKTMERLIIPFVILLMGLLIFLTFQDVSRLF